jgi:3'(2'), 5'-bisphosphate nucleotidase
VTAADIVSDMIIKKGLEKITPGINVFSEETMDINYSERYSWEPLWILDPLDGTREFIQHIDEFCISLALVSGARPVAGFIHSPVSKETWIAVKGEGAFRIVSGERSSLPLYDPEGPVKIAVSRSHLIEAEEAWIRKFSREYSIVEKPLGSAIKFCRIAEGEYDLYPKFGKINEWDVAAGNLIVEEAGGKMLEIATGGYPVYNKVNHLQPPFIVFGRRFRNPGKYLVLN